MKNIFNKRNLITLASVIGSSALMAFSMNIFMGEASLLASGIYGSC